ncbi:nitrous oxide reductase family maturation protein NosD [Jiulongibacter sediminis]|uniref:Carbohydrate-binding/sugar hydrolysis domain-containing protein n=1 Tax=Jiulongibacter sediminis TaxID=1605367 RepID=A0A0P7C4F5_9BACT|nr:nitrous oxide reductase family maturation protein NosD [Jiulongibacter sediminis]KPM46785.1 hypothetical protein AFM12_18715 [Jiulongibacter sediminis]TBX21689.1 hypothetical protein TK44_18720 [Jiulongibacter sediminis]
MGNVLKYLVFFILLPVMVVQAKELTVTDVTALRQAVEEAKDGDIIKVKKGVYLINHLEITSSIELIGEPGAILDGQNKGEIITVKANNVLIKGLTVQNVGSSSTIDWAAIKVLEARNVQIIENIIKQGFFGIYFSASNQCLATGNIIEGSPLNEQNTGNGIHAWKCDSLFITENRVSGHRDGYYFEFVTNSQVEHNNSFANMRYGLHFMFSHQNAYRDNVFEHNGAGVAVMYSRNVEMTRNKFIRNWGGAAYGILLKDITDSHISQNTFDYNTIGVVMEGCNRIGFEKNVFGNNGTAIRIQANCENVICQYNDFLNNSFDIETNGNAVNYAFNSNFWDKYDGYDLDKDGFGDYAFRPVSLFSRLVGRIPEAMMLFRSLTATLLDRIEKVFPTFTPENVKDLTPQMTPNIV